MKYVILSLIVLTGLFYLVLTDDNISIGLGSSNDLNDDMVRNKSSFDRVNIDYDNPTRLRVDDSKAYVYVGNAYSFSCSRINRTFYNSTHCE